MLRGVLWRRMSSFGKRPATNLMKRAVMFGVPVALMLALMLAFQASPSNPPHLEVRLNSTNIWSSEKRGKIKLPSKLFNQAHGWGVEKPGDSESAAFIEMPTLGRVTNGFPVAWLGNQMLCAQESKPRPSMQKARNWLNRISRGWIPPLSRWCRFWLFDVDQGTTVCIGKFPYSGFQPYHYTPSSDFQHGFTVQNAYPLLNSYWLDLTGRRICHWDLPTKPLGWWDNTHILYHPTNDDVCLYDVNAGKTSTLVTSSQVAQFLRTNQMVRPARSLYVRQWRDYGKSNSSEPEPQKHILGFPDSRLPEFYLAAGSWIMTNSVVIHIARPDGRLEPVSDPHLNMMIDDTFRSFMEE